MHIAPVNNWCWCNDLLLCIETVIVWPQLVIDSVSVISALIYNWRLHNCRDCWHADLWPRWLITMHGEVSFLLYQNCSNTWFAWLLIDQLIDYNWKDHHFCFCFQKSQMSRLRELKRFPAGGKEWNWMDWHRVEMFLLKYL